MENNNPSVEKIRKKKEGLDMRNKTVLTGLIVVLSIATFATGCGEKPGVIEEKMESTSESVSEITVETTTSNTETETTTSTTVTEGTTTEDSSTEHSTTQHSTTQTPTVTEGTTTEDSSTEHSTTQTPTTDEPQPATPAHTHSYSPADCTHAATCSCGATNGSPLGHDYGNNNKTCSRCGNPNPNYQAPGVEVGTKVEIGTYSTSDLVANGVCPDGYASGTTVRFYRVYDGSVWQKYVQVDFSGSTIPSDFSASGSIQGPTATNTIVTCLKRGVSRTFNYGWESFGV